MHMAANGYNGLQGNEAEMLMISLEVTYSQRKDNVWAGQQGSYRNI